MRSSRRRGRSGVAACVVKSIFTTSIFTTSIFTASAFTTSILATPAALATLVATATVSANAQSYPDRPIRLIVPAAPGGPTDMPARLLSQILPALGQPVVIENRPGAGGAIGARFVAASAPDGHTLLVGNTSVLAVIPAVSAAAGYDPSRQFAAVAKVSESYQVLVVHPRMAAKTVSELIAAAKADPGKLTYAHSGPGGLPHLTGELFKSAASIDILGVPYKSGGDSVAALLGGQVDMTFESVTIVLPLIQDARLRGLAVTGRSRTPLASALPTMIEAGVPDYEVTTFNGVVAPAGTPQPIVAVLNTTINNGLRTPEMQANLHNLGAVSATGSAAEFGAFIAAEQRKWSAAAKAVNVGVN
jgi:tripartite-type tricarboxylate transporter receptor subunit TctC